MLSLEGLVSQDGYEALGMMVDAGEPDSFQLDVAPGGVSASWSTVAQYYRTYLHFYSCDNQIRNHSESAGLGPFIDPAGGDVVFFHKLLTISNNNTCVEASTCTSGEFSKRAAPQWSFGTNDVCAYDELAFTGDAAGNVVTREDARLKKYDPSGAVVLDVPTPFDFSPTALGLSAMGDIHGAVRSSNEIRLAKTEPSGTLAWTKTFPDLIPKDFSSTLDLAVDAFGNSIVAFYAYETMDLGNGPMPAIGAKDLVLAKFNVQGNVLWAKRVGGGEIIASTMRKTGADEIALVVHFTGTVDLGDGLLQSSPVLVKYDASGNLVWRADLLPLYPPSAPEVLSVAISGHPSGAVFVAGTGYGLASSTPEPHCDIGGSLAHPGDPILPKTYPRPLRMFAAKYGP